MRFLRAKMGHPPCLPSVVPPPCAETRTKSSMAVVGTGEKDPFIAVGRKVSSESEVSSIQIPEEASSDLRGGCYPQPRGGLRSYGSGSSTCRSVRSTVLLGLGLLSSILGIFCLIFSNRLEDIILQFLQSNTALVPGPMLSAWLDPPIIPNLQIYLYNITNPTQVLGGQDPVLKEIGPYVYSAQHVRTLIQETTTYPDSIAFNTRTIYKFQPHLSVGLETDKLVMINLVMLTGFAKARFEPEMIRRGIVWPLLTSTGLKQPLVDVTVGGFLFGYEDNLACILDGDSGAAVDSAGEKDTRQEAEDEEGEWVDWGDEEEEETKKEKEKKTLDGIPSYREKSGKCMWGLLKHLNTTNSDIIRMNSGRSRFPDKGVLYDLSGKTTFGAWQKGSSCDRIAGSRDATSLPPALPARFPVLVNVMCRNIPLVAVANHSIEGIPVTRYIADPSSLDQQECYCPKPHIHPCLPSGYLNLAPCYPEISPPLAVSFPQSLHAFRTSGDWGSDGGQGSVGGGLLWGHVPSPDPDRHQTYFDINLDIGAPLAAQVRFELSAVLQPDPVFPLLSGLNTTRLVPLLWASEGFDAPNPWLLDNVRMVLSIPSLAVLGGAIANMSIGIGILVFKLFQYLSFGR